MPLPAAARQSWRRCDFVLWSYVLIHYVASINFLSFVSVSWDKEELIS